MSSEQSILNLFIQHDKMIHVLKYGFTFWMALYYLDHILFNKFIDHTISNYALGLDWRLVIMFSKEIRKRFIEIWKNQLTCSQQKWLIGRLQEN